MSMLGMGDSPYQGISAAMPISSGNIDPISQFMLEMTHGKGNPILSSVVPDEYLPFDQFLGVTGLRRDEAMPSHNFKNLF